MTLGAAFKMRENIRIRNEFWNGTWIFIFISNELGKGINIYNNNIIPYAYAPRQIFQSFRLWS